MQDGVLCQNSQQLLALTIFAKCSTLDVWHGFEKYQRCLHTDSKQK